MPDSQSTPAYENDDDSLNRDTGLGVIRQHLALFGIQTADLTLFYQAEFSDAAFADNACADGRPVVACLPDAEFCAAFGLSTTTSSAEAPTELSLTIDQAEAWSRLRTLFRFETYVHDEATLLVTEKNNVAASYSGPWVWVPHRSSGILFIGTDLARDLVRYRQGDPAQVKVGQSNDLWGFAGERPLYLFEPQLADCDPLERFCDWWCQALVRCLEVSAGVKAEPIFPDGAVGALLLTGDDDQAALSNYARQVEVIADCPITYFLHPLTKLTRNSFEEIFAAHRVDMGLHPDALDAPNSYSDLFAEQAEWYRSLTGIEPFGVRNHGFLNDGYWGHLNAWESANVRFSSNLPGVDGRVLNGSLLPAAVVFEGGLTSHLNLLTTIGDGIMFALGQNSKQAADTVRRSGQSIRDSRVPGVVVLNLHPDNIATTEPMHEAALELVSQGFVAWTMRECVEWFDKRIARLAGATIS